MTAFKFLIIITSVILIVFFYHAANGIIILFLRINDSRCSHVGTKLLVSFFALIQELEIRFSRWECRTLEIVGKSHESLVTIVNSLMDANQKRFDSTNRKQFPIIQDTSRSLEQIHT